MSRQKNRVRTKAALALLLSMTWISHAHGFASGTGEPNDPYQIATAEQLLAIGSDPNLLDKHFVLLNDIDLDPNLPGGQVFTRAVIAPSASGSAAAWSGTPFTGSLDGAGHEICSLTIRNPTGHHSGLFGRIGKEEVVKDLGIENAYVGEEAGLFHGAMAAENEGRVVRCYSRAYVSGRAEVGGLVGYNRGDIIECWAAGEVVAPGAVGGLVGLNGGGAIVGSYATTMVVDPGSYVDEAGGLVGRNEGGVIANCYAAGDVSATIAGSLGGLVGLNGPFALVVHSYATGNVSTETIGGSVGGLVGKVDDSSINDCFASGDVYGSTVPGGLVGSISWGGGYISRCYATGRVTPSENDLGIERRGTRSSHIPEVWWEPRTVARSRIVSEMLKQADCPKAPAVQD